MNLTVQQLTISDYVSRVDRYFPIEANGVVGVMGWVQRPAAINNTKRHGKGLYDAREKKIIQQPDRDERLMALKGAHDAKVRELAKIDAVIASVEAMVPK